MAIIQPFFDSLICAETKYEKLQRKKPIKLPEIKYARNPSPKSRKH